MDIVLSIVERYLILCPFLGGSYLRDSTVLNSSQYIGLLYCSYIFQSGQVCVSSRLSNSSYCVLQAQEFRDCSRYKILLLSRS